MGTQKIRLTETVLLSTQNICSKLWARKYLQFYAENICLSKPVKSDMISLLNPVSSSLLQLLSFLILIKQVIDKHGRHNEMPYNATFHQGLQCLRR